MNRNITKAKSFDASSITYREVVVNKRGGKSVQIQVDGQPLVLQIPLIMGNPPNTHNMGLRPHRKFSRGL